MALKLLDYLEISFLFKVIDVIHDEIDEIIQVKNVRMLRWLIHGSFK